MCFFFFKQKTAYEMRISDWSSDVCSSDLRVYRLRTLDKGRRAQPIAQDRGALEIERLGRILHLLFELVLHLPRLAGEERLRLKIGRASCRERVCQYV